MKLNSVDISINEVISNNSYNYCVCVLLTINIVITPKLITIFTVLSTQTLTYNFIYSDKLNFCFFSMLIYSKIMMKFPKQKNC